MLSIKCSKTMCFIQLVYAFSTLLVWGVGVFGVKVMSAWSATFAKPLCILWIMGVSMGDLLLRSPIIAGRYRYYRYVINKTEKCVRPFAPMFQKDTYQKCVAIRLYTWRKRGVLTSLLMIPSAVLYALSGGADAVDGWVIRISADMLLLAAVITAECFMLRYMAVWDVMDDCATLKETVTRSKRVMKHRTGDAMGFLIKFYAKSLFCLLIVPYFTYMPRLLTERAAWIEQQRRLSITRDEYFDDCGKHYKRAHRRVPNRI